MQALDPSGRYSDAAVLAALRAVAGARTLSYRFDRLSASNGYLGALSGVLKASLALNSLADIKRTAKFTVLDSVVIDYLKDRIQPFARLAMLGDAAVYAWTGAANNSPSTRTDARTGEIRTNLVYNPSFEVDTSGWVGESGGVVTRDTVSPISGTASAKLTGGGDAYTFAYGINAGDVVTFSFDYRTNGTIAGAPRIYLACNGTAAVASPLPLTQLTPGRFSITSTSIGTGFAICAIFFPTAGGTVWIDNVLVEKAASAGAYLDGSFASFPGFVEWPLGVFLLSTPTRSLVGGSYVARDVEAYDQLVVLRDNKTADRLSYPAGTVYTTALAAIASSYGFVQNVTPSALVMPAAMEWDPGTTYLRVVNDLLAAINYESASFDEVGRFVAKPYVSPTVRASGYTYATDAVSVISGDVTQTIDLFSVPNKWVLVVSEADRPPLIGTYVNASPASPTSTVARGRTIVDYRTEQDAADQITLDAKAARLAVDASQVFESITFSTAVMPIHSGGDVYSIGISELVIDAKFSEQSWSYDLAPGALMKHEARRVVNV